MAAKIWGRSCKMFQFIQMTPVRLSGCKKNHSIKREIKPKLKIQLKFKTKQNSISQLLLKVCLSV